MADVTISELGVVGVSVDKLLSQIKEAGLPHTKADELISNDDKNTLLVFLRRSHGDRDATSAAPKKITLKRKTLGTLKSASSTGQGKRSMSRSVKSAPTSSEARSRHQSRKSCQQQSLSRKLKKLPQML